MRIKRVTEKNLEFITNQLQPHEPITLNKKTNTYVFYEEKINAIVQEKKEKKTQKIEVTKYDKDFSIAQMLPVMCKTRYVELPKEDNIESMMEAMNYKKIREDNGYQTYERKRETVIGMINLFKTLKQFNIRQQLRNYFKLWEDEPEFKLYEILSIIDNASSGALLGAVTPAFWDYGGVLKLAGTLNAIQKIGTPLTNVFSSGSMGNLVDKATVTTDIKDLKELQKKVGWLNTFTTTGTYLMQPSIIQLTPSPEATLLTLYTLQTIGMTAGKMSLESKSFFAIRDYLIRKNPELDNAEHKERFYQTIGTGQALSQLCYAATFTPTWLICKANPALILPIATVSGIVLIISKFLWAFQRRLKNPVMIKAKEYVEKGNAYVFDTGWTVQPGKETQLEKKLGGYQLPLREGVTIKSEESITINEKKYGLELVTEKSMIQIKTKEGYELKKVSDKEYNITSKRI